MLERERGPLITHLVFLYVVTPFALMLPAVDFLPQVVLGGFALFLLLSLSALRPEVQSRGLPVPIGLWLLMCWTLLSAYWSRFPYLVVQRSLMLVATAIPLNIMVLSDRQVTVTFFRIQRFILWLGFGLAFYGIALRATGSLTWMEGRLCDVLSIGPFRFHQTLWGVPPLLRIGSLTNNPNTLAELLILSSTAATSLVAMQRLSKPTYLALESTIVVGLAMTVSRAGIGAWCLATALQILLPRNRGGSRWRVIVPVILIVAALVFALPRLPVELLHVLAGRLGDGLNQRTVAWDPLIGSIMEHPFIGVGFGLSREQILQPRGIELAAHNVHLEMISEMGLVGYLIVVGLWLPAIIRAFLEARDTAIPRDSQIMKATSGALLAALVFHQLFEASIFRFSPIHWMWVYLISL